MSRGPTQTADHTPAPLTALGRRVADARALIEDLLTELLGPVGLDFGCCREWNGCWKARVDLSGAVSGRLEFTLLTTPAGGRLALPRPLPKRWRSRFGVRASDGSRWTLDASGQQTTFAAAAGPG